MASYEDEDELPPQATSGLTRRVPTAGRSWQQRRVIQGAGSAARTVGTAWSRLTSQQREQFGNQRRFREHLSRAAMARAMQQEDAKEEAARQAGRAAANASTSNSPATAAGTSSGTAQPPPTPQSAAVIRPGDPAAAPDLDGIRKSLTNQSMPRTPGRITAESYERPEPGQSANRPSGLSYDNQGQVIRDWVGSAPTRPASTPPPAQEQGWATQRRRSTLPNSTSRQSYLQRIRSRVG